MSTAMCSSRFLRDYNSMLKLRFRCPWLLALVPLLGVGWLCLLAGKDDTTNAGQRKQAARNGPRCKVPPGFVVEKVAGPPLVEHPTMACFDERGRLFVAETVGKNLPFTDLVKNPPNLIRVLEPAGDDGRFHKSSVFADKMTFPMGVLWHDGALYTAAAPSFWRL